MNRTLLMAAAFTLVVAGGAAAQDPHEDHRGAPPHPAAAAHAPVGGRGGPPAQDYRAAPPAAGVRAAAPTARFDGFQGQGVGPHAPARVFYHGRSFSSFRAAPFYYPGGWGYRRWDVGQVLPGLFLTQSYFIGNWAAYGLGPPPPGLEWVRYGPDALLVNVYTGQIVDTVYGVFWW